MKCADNIKEKLRINFKAHPMLYSALLIVTLCCITFGRGLSGDFVLDDWPVIKENSKITEAKYIPGYFTSGVWANTDWADEVGMNEFRLYRPLLLLVLNIEYRLWGDSPLGYHVFNLLLHCINSLLVFILTFNLLRVFDNKSTKIKAATLGAIMFAVHPVHAESIAWTLGMNEPLAALFLLSGIISYQKYSITRKSSFGVLAIVWYMAALLCKESVILLPLLIIAHDKLIENKVFLWRYVPYGLLLVFYFIIRSAVLTENSDEVFFDIGQWPVLLEFVTHYIQLLFIPWPLEFYYGRPPSNILSIIFGACVIFSVLFFMISKFMKLSPLFIFAIIWVVATLAPALSVALIKDPVFAMRVLYLPSVGVGLVVAWLYSFSGEKPQRIIIGFCSVIVIIFVSLSIIETGDWKNDEVFYSEAAIASPQSYKPYQGLALSYERSNRDYKAIDANLKAASLSHDDDYYRLLEDVGRLYGQNGDIQNSERYYQEVLRLAPQRSSSWVGMGNNAYARQDLNQALDYYQTAFNADPTNIIASYNLAMVYRNLGNMEQAMHYQRITQQLQK